MGNTSRMCIRLLFVSLMFMLLFVEVKVESAFAVNVDDKTGYAISNTRWNRRTGIMSQDVTITNTSSQDLYAPLIATAKNVPEPITAANSDGTKPSGDPYWDYTALLTDGKLPPGSSVTMRWGFNNPTRAYFTYGVEIEAWLSRPVTVTANPTSGDAPLKVFFYATTTITLVNYEWDFDGNGTYDYSNPTSGDTTYVYTTPGVYNARIRVTDDTGAIATVVIRITVSKPVRSLPSASPTSGFAPLQVTFTAAGTSSTGTLEHFYWDYDGNGTWDAHLRIPDITQYTYTRADTYNAALRVVDSNNHEDIAIVTITVSYASPTVTVNTDVDNGPPPLTVNFTATANSPNGAIVNYEWDFDGDGVYDASSTTAQISHTYTTAGVFNATVRVTDALGMTQTAVIVIRTQPLTVTAGADTTAGNAPLTVNFTGSATSPNGAIAKYEWDFDGDGTYDWNSTTTGNTSYTYDRGGIFNAILKATDVTGASGIDSITITVNIIIGLTINPTGFNPTQGETTTIRTIYSGGATIDILIKDKSMAIIRRLVSGANRPAGQYDDVWDGRDGNGQLVLDGSYYFIVEARMPGGLTQIHDVTGTTGGTRHDLGGYHVAMPPTFFPYNDQFCPVNYNIPKAGEVSFYIYALQDERGNLLYDIRVKTIFERVPHAAGSYVAIWDGTNDRGQLVNTGWRYIVTIWSWDLPDNGVVVKGGGPIISNVSADPNYYDPSYHADVPVGFRNVTVSYNLSEAANVTLRVFDYDNNLVRTITQANVPVGDSTITWDGRNAAGKLVLDERYSIGLKATDAEGNKSPTMYALILLFY